MRLHDWQGLGDERFRQGGVGWVIGGVKAQAGGGTMEERRHHSGEVSAAARHIEEGSVPTGYYPAQTPDHRPCSVTSQDAPSAPAGCTELLETDTVCDKGPPNLTQGGHQGRRAEGFAEKQGFPWSGGKQGANILALLATSTVSA